MLLMMLGHCLSLSLTGVRENVLILPRQMNDIAPFKLKADKNDAGDTVLTLSVECSKDLEKSLSFGSAQAPLCPSYSKIGTLTQINDFLGSIKATSSTNLDNVRIKYTVRKPNEDITELTSSVSQTFELANQIPVKMLTPIIKIASGSSSSELVSHVLSISDEYFVNAGKNLFSLKLEQSYDWLTYQFKDAELYMTIKTTKTDEITDTTVTFNVVDNTNGLESTMFNVKFDLFASASKGTSKTDSQLYFLIFLGIFTLVIIVFIFVLYFTNKRMATQENLKESIDGQKRANQNTPTTNQSFDGKTNVLSDSIINWNKKLVARHKDKTNVILDMSHSKEQSSLNAPDITNNYQRFDESDRAEEHSREHNAEGFQDISDIQQDDISVKSQEIHQRSSFLEDFKF
jgi:hypothetical protein